ncbi:hypothetical protein [Pinibacter soli]|uniref:DUF4595 domain-containing protein n=1 Tax=Pinibacter soli TaxID=3044211 RepID=A0ABT6RHH0_9BACT|nr:hypothetical protein [Pinibacter soli]MDI3322010.1 hypothetical protein [Pinibacter soli]
MKKNKLANAVFALSLAFATFLTSCQKLIDYINKPGNGKDVSDICQVQTVSSVGQYGPANYVFNYNKRNELESIIATPLGTGNPNTFFIYDKKHRVSQVLYSFTATPTTPGQVWAWHKFDFNKADQIIRDTMYGFTVIGPDGAVVPSPQFLSVSIINYDAYDRVVASDDSVWAFGSFANTYHYAYKYDGRGNLAYQARQYRGTTNPLQPYNDTFRIAPYDDKISIRQTNKMWMFIDRNYSINNSFSSATYNNYGLPVYFDGFQYLQGLVTLLPFIYGNVTVQYLCDGKGNSK